MAVKLDLPLVEEALAPCFGHGFTLEQRFVRRRLRGTRFAISQGLLRPPSISRFGLRPSLRRRAAWRPLRRPTAIHGGRSLQTGPVRTGRGTSQGPYLGGM